MTILVCSCRVKGVKDRLTPLLSLDSPTESGENLRSARMILRFGGRGWAADLVSAFSGWVAREFWVGCGRLPSNRCSVWSWGEEARVDARAADGRRAGQRDRAAANRRQGR